MSDRITTHPVAGASPAVNPAQPGPTVVPLGPPLASGAQAGVVPVGPATLGPAWTDAVVDPWAPSAGSRVVLAERPLARGGHSDWAREIDEIVDPWKRGPLAAFRDPIIVDPWAR